MESRRAAKCSKSGLKKILTGTMWNRKRNWMSIKKITTSTVRGAKTKSQKWLKPSTTGVEASRPALGPFRVFTPLVRHESRYVSCIYFDSLRLFIASLWTSAKVNRRYLGSKVFATHLIKESCKNEGSEAATTGQAIAGAVVKFVTAIGPLLEDLAKITAEQKLGGPNTLVNLATKWDDGPNQVTPPRTQRS